MVFPAPVAERMMVAPGIGLLFPSRAVTVIVADSVPASIDGALVATVERPCDTAPAVTVTPTVCVTDVSLTVADTVLMPASVELTVPVA